MSAPLPAAPFPLPLIGLPARSISRSSRSKQRIAKARMATRLANSCSQSLNVLAGFIGPPLVVLPLSSVVGHQRSAVDHLSACPRRFVSRLGTSVHLSVDENKCTFSLIQRHSHTHVPLVVGGNPRPPPAGLFKLARLTYFI